MRFSVIILTFRYQYGILFVEAFYLFVYQNLFSLSLGWSQCQESTTNIDDVTSTDAPTTTEAPTTTDAPTTTENPANFPKTGEQCGRVLHHKSDAA